LRLYAADQGQRNKVTEIRPRSHGVFEAAWVREGWGEGMLINNQVGLKHDQGKQPWYAMPLTVLKPLADVFRAGEVKYKTFNCLNPFNDSDRRFWDATMRHLEACQIDPLAIDEETGCYHGAQAAFNILLRVHNAKMRIRG
jgi:hypothetical protein